MPPPNIVENPGAAAVPSGAIPVNSRAEIRVTAPTVNRTTEPAAPVQRETTPATTQPNQPRQTAKQRMRDELAKIGVSGEQSNTSSTLRSPETKTPESETVQAGNGTEQATGETPVAETGPTPEEKKAKVNPWKLRDEAKKRADAAEARAAELEKLVGTEADRKKQADHFTAVEKRNKELESEMRYVDYTKTAEFQDKYRVPYESAWKSAMTELAELEVVLPDKSTRPITPQDILELVNMPLPRARAEAERVFGPFANDVMDHRKEIRRLFDNQTKALDEARKLAETRTDLIKKRTEEVNGAMQKQINETWNKANEEVMADSRISQFFKPVEGNKERNTILEKGFQMVDRAFTSTPNDPNHTPEKRAEIVRLHAAVRHRAAAFGVMRHELERAQTTISELQKELEQFKGSAPDIGGGSQPSGTQPKMTAKQRMASDLQKIAVTR